MENKITPIDIPEGRKLILKSISEFRRIDKLVGIVRAHFDLIDQTWPKKKIDKRSATDLHQKLVQEEDLKVYAVNYKAGKQLMTDRMVYTFTVRAYDLQWQSSLSFDIKVKSEPSEAGVESLEMDDCFTPHQTWGTHADYLESILPGFAARAVAFNNALEKLTQLSKVASPPGELGAIYPLSDLFHWYRLPN